MHLLFHAGVSGRTPGNAPPWTASPFGPRVMQQKFGVIFKSDF
jgi:hypothetical protein